MTEMPPLHALIIDDEPGKVARIQVAWHLYALAEQGELTVATADSLNAVENMYQAGELNADAVDVAFVDANLGAGRYDGAQVLNFLVREGLARTPFGRNIDRDPIVPDPDKIVTVGASADWEWALDLGSSSDVVGHPLIVNWGRPSLGLDTIAREVRRLKPRRTNE